MIYKAALNKAGIDRAVAYTIFSRIIQAGGGVVSVVFISRFLSAIEQGYYYTFSSILAIQIFFELGLSGIITQYTAHESAHLEWSENLKVNGDDYYKSRLSSLLVFCLKWFGIVSIALFFILTISGFYFFSKYDTHIEVNWKNPWVILSLTTALNLFIDPILAFMEGLGHVKDMAKVRMIQRIVYILLLFTFFALGFKLYSAALASLLAILTNYFQILFSKRLIILKEIWLSRGEWSVSYLKEIFPFQWKIALSWISGYFIFQLFNPVLFATEGSKIAGQMGMTLAALNGVLSLSISWISTKIPTFSNLIAKKEYSELDNLFSRTVRRANLVCIVCLLILTVFIELLKYNHLSIGDRFLPILPLSFLVLCTFLNQYVFALATYLRCHKKEPFLAQSITMAILTAISTIVLGKYFGVNGITIGYTTLFLLIGAPWAIQIFRDKKKEWHS